MGPIRLTAVVLCTMTSSVAGNAAQAADQTLIDYFLPMPVRSPLDRDLQRRGT